MGKGREEKERRESGDGGGGMEKRGMREGRREENWCR